MSQIDKANKREDAWLFGHVTVEFALREVRKELASGAAIAAVVLLAIIIFGALIVAATVELVDCPKCHNNVLFKYLCTKCGGDGRVTILQQLSG